MGLRIVDVAGSPREMGREHALVAGDALAAFAADRVHLAGQEAWTGRSLDRSSVLALAERCVDAHRSYSPDLTAELSAMAEVAGLSLAELVIVNGFTDFIDTVYSVGGSAAEREAPTRSAAPPGAAPPGAAPPGADDCTAFLVPRSRSADAHALFAQTWDMHRSAEDHLIVLRGAPRDAPAFVTFTTLGCVGMIGMNEHGVCVGINNLSGGDGRVGVTWPFVVREVLRQGDLDGALHSLARADLAGAHNYLLLDRHGRGANIEATSTARHVTPLERAGLVHTNHCVAPGPLVRQRPRDPETQAASVRRLSRGEALLDRHDLTPADLEAATRDPDDICYRGGPPRHLATCGAVVARPATLDFWAIAGLPSEGEFERVPLPA